MSAKDAGKRGDSLGLGAATPESCDEREGKRAKVADGEDEQIAEGAILFAMFQKGTIGIALYTPGSNDIRYLESVEDAAFSTLKMAMYENAPAIVSTSQACSSEIDFLRVLASSPDDLLADKNLRRRPTSQHDDDYDHDDLYPIPEERNDSHSLERENSEDDNALQLEKIHFLKTAECSIDSAMEKLSVIRVASMPASVTTLHERLAFLASCIDVDHVFGRRAVGALLSLLFKQKISGHLETNQNPMYLDGLEQLNLDQHMRMTPQAFHSLQIFQKDTHPLLAGSGRAKEGLSLFGIVNRTRTPQGAHLLKQWFSRPLYCTREIASRQLSVKALLSVQQADLFSEILDILRGVRNVSGILKRIRNIMASVRDWANLLLSAKSFLRLGELLSSNTSLGSIRSFQDLRHAYDTQRICNLNELLQRTVDFDRSTEEKRLVVNDGVCSEVDELRTVYHNMDEFLTDVGIQELQSLAQDGLRVSQLQVIYFPQIGYLISIPKELLANVEMESFSQAGLEFLFASTDAQFFKNDQMASLDQEVGDIHGAIRDREGAVVRAMEKEVLTYSHDVLCAAKFAAHVDCLQSFASAAAEYDWVCPEVVAERGVEIEDGRHPLQELCVSSFIPNGCRLGPGSVCLVSGPNYSGKSVYVKQVAVLVFMAQIGLFVSAKSARIGLVDQIIPRIRSFESVSLQQSSFFIDCSQVAFALRHATSNSLLVLDEFGKGTNESDGMSLLAAVIQSVLDSSRENSPTMLVATHFKELITSNFVRVDSDRLSVGSMEVLSQPAGADQSGTESDLIYLYRLTDGMLASESHAIRCASLAGVSKDILRRAFQIQAIVSGANGEDTIDINLINSLWTSKFEAEERAFNKFQALDIDSCNDLGAFLEDL